MTVAARVVRCYNCGRRCARDGVQCTRCGAAFRALCPCGADISIYDEECAACRTPHVPKRLPTSRHPYARAAKWTIALLAAGFAANALFASRPVPAWKLKARAFERYTAKDFDAAARVYRSVVEQTPGDAEAWYMYAVCLRQAGVGPDAYVPAAERAVLIAPLNLPARDFLARCELAEGHVDRALVHAEAALKAPLADGRTYRLLADIELRRPRPDLARALDALEKAVAAGVDAPEVSVTLAEVSLGLYGVQAAEAGRLPPALSASLLDALTALDSLAAQGRDPVAVGIARARVLLALGRRDDAFIAAHGALSRVPTEAPAAERADALLLRGMALYARGDRPGATADFGAALRAAPQARIAASAASFLADADDADAACALLLGASAQDPSGEIRATLAGLYLRLSRLDDAAKTIQSARADAPAVASFAEIQGAVAAAQGRPDAARAAFAEASGMSPEAVGPRVGAALAGLAGVPEAARRGALERAAAELRALRGRFGDDPRVLSALGRVLLAVDDVAGARDALERAKDAAPADASVWRALGEARRRSGSPEAAAEAAAAFARARTFEPRDPSLVVAEAQARMDAGEEAGAVAACTDYLRVRPDDPAVLALRADAYRRLAMWGPAAADLRRLHEAHRADEHVLVLLVDSLFQSGATDAALRAAADLPPDAAPDARLRLGAMAALVHRDLDTAKTMLRDAGADALLAGIELAAGRREDAVASLRRARARRPDDAYAARLLVVALVDDDPPVAERVAEARAVLASLPADAPAGLLDLLEGRVLLAEGRPADAAKRLASAADAAPSDPFAALFLAEALFRAGDRTKSLASFRRAASASAATPRMREIAGARLLQASLEEKDAATAEALSREAVRFAPENADAAERLTELLQARGAFAEAAENAERGLRVAGLAAANAVRLRYLAASARRANGQSAAARAILDGLDAKERASPNAGLLRGYSCLDAHEYDDADREFASVLAVEPSRAAAQRGRIEAALAAGRGDAAASLHAQWRKDHPTDRAFVLAAARIFARFGRSEQAAAMLAQALADAPDDVAIGAAYATLTCALRRPADGVAAFRRIVEATAAPRRAAVRILLGHVLVATQDGADEALSIARRAEADAPADGPLSLDAQVLEAEALLAARRTSEAEVAAARIARRWKEGAAPSEERGEEERVQFVLGSAASTSTKRAAEAVRRLTRCVELDPADDAAANNLAWMLGARSDTAAAGFDLAKTLTQRAPQTPDYWDTRAFCSAAAGNAGDAESSWRRAQELFAAQSCDPATRAESARRFAEFLRRANRSQESVDVAKAALAYAAGTRAEAELRRFLAE